ncbi:MAG: 2-phosphosulfolactate phosphatase, partial [Synergistetes bacterium]|nr:2-phosphosulfolactate phosphatase [Synergistota bacterium]
MLIDVTLAPGRTPLSDIAVGIDVLRASSSIVTALAKGASQVVITSSIKEARILKKKIPNSILAGE